MSWWYSIEVAAIICVGLLATVGDMLAKRSTPEPSEAVQSKHSAKQAVRRVKSAVALKVLKALNEKTSSDRDETDPKKN
jgi:hypothetical protein